MLAITPVEYKNFGCPNCGCDNGYDAISDFEIGFETYATSITCRHCRLHFAVNTPNMDGSTRYSAHQENPAECGIMPKYVMEAPIRITHPRNGIQKWHWEPKDERPEGNGEYWASRGPGVPDVSGFVRSKYAGERILDIVHRVLGKTECKTWLDYRPFEPTWIQFKFHRDEFDINKLHTLSTENNGIITEEIIRNCKL
jgi:hypothetical protein